MADGDTYDQHGRLWWKTCARKLFAKDPTFEGSAIWSIDKVLRDGNLTAIADLARLIAETCRLRNQRIDSQVFLDIRLQQIAQTHWDQDSQTAIGIARCLSVDTNIASEIGRLTCEGAIIRAAHELLARVAVENCCVPGLVHALQNESGVHRLTRERFLNLRDRGIRLLGQSEGVKQRACRQLQNQHEINAAPVALTRPRASVDHQALVHEALSV